MGASSFSLNILLCSFYLSSFSSVHGYLNKINNFHPIDNEVRPVLGEHANGINIPTARFGLSLGNRRTAAADQHILKVQTPQNFGSAKKHAVRAFRHTIQGIGSLIGAKLGIGVGAIAGSMAGAASGIFSGAKKGAFIGAKFGAKPFKVDTYDGYLPARPGIYNAQPLDLYGSYRYPYLPDIREVQKMGKASDETHIGAKSYENSYDIYDIPYAASSGIESRSMPPHNYYSGTLLRYPEVPASITERQFDEPDYYRTSPTISVYSSPFIKERQQGPAQDYFGTALGYPYRINTVRRLGTPSIQYFSSSSNWDNS